MKKKIKNQNSIFIILLAILFILFASFMITKQNKQNKTLTPIYKNSGYETFHLGIDVSEHQGTIDWKAVANSSVDFAIIRASYAWDNGQKDHRDQMFSENLSEAKKHGLAVGVYHYSYATNEQEALEEAKLLLSQINGTQLDYPVYYDLEDECQDDLSTEQITNIALTFINEIRNAGYYAGIYINPDNIKQLDLDQLGDVDLWIANYSLENSYDGDYGMWQYTCYGKINGIEGNVDLNYCYYDYPSFIKKLHKNKN